MGKPSRPTAVYTNNNWYFEIPGIVSPNFQKLSGIEASSGEVTIVDGVTNLKHKFSSQIKEFSDVTLERAYDGSEDDNYMRALQKISLVEGQRFDGQLVKLHAGREVFRILFLGARLKKVSHPSLDTGGEDIYNVSYTLSVTEWVEIPV